MSSPIKLFCTDIDGTLTDGMMTFDHEGNVSKSYHTRDITALWLLQQAGVDVIVLTGSLNPCDEHRFRFLQGIKRNHISEDVPYLTQGAIGIKGKMDYISGILKANKLFWNEVAFIGDAENDQECLAAVGFSACPKDAHETLLSEVHFVSSFDGGAGAVREFSERVLLINEKLYGAKK